jgi:hypothetical protein
MAHVFFGLEKIQANSGPHEIELARYSLMTQAFQSAMVKAISNLTFITYRCER